MRPFRFFADEGLAMEFRQRTQGTMYTNEPGSKTVKYCKLYTTIAQDTGENVTDKPFVVVWE